MASASGRSQDRRKPLPASAWAACQALNAAGPSQAVAAASLFGRHNGRRNRQLGSWWESERRDGVRHGLADDSLRPAFLEAASIKTPVGLQKTHAVTVAPTGPRATSRPRPAEPVNAPSR